MTCIHLPENILPYEFTIEIPVGQQNNSFTFGESSILKVKLIDEDLLLFIIIRNRFYSIDTLYIAKVGENYFF